MAALLLLVVAIGAGLQSQLSFGGPIWTPPGVAGKPPQALSTATPPPQPTAAPTTNNSSVTFSWVPILLVLSVLALAVILVFVLLWLRNRPRRGLPQPFAGVDADVDDVDLAEQPPADLPTLQRGLARAAEVLESDREPRDAIVRAWLGLQEAAEDSGMSRRASETPTEFTTRVFESVRADRTAAGTLLALYLRVRFGVHPATAEDVRKAQDAVTALSATWPARAGK
jgi:Domain of unknown function (DUF4129)